VALIRAVVDTRISHDPEGEALRVQRQRQDCLDQAAREGWHVVDVVVENDVGASSYSRNPDRCMRSCCSGHSAGSSTSSWPTRTAGSPAARWSWRS
jgi:hypothetical protein